MTITSIKKMIWTCDRCGKTDTAEGEDMEGEFEPHANPGWITVEDHGRWMDGDVNLDGWDLCPDCSPLFRAWVTTKVREPGAEARRRRPLGGGRK